MHEGGYRRRGLVVYAHLLPHLAVNGVHALGKPGVLPAAQERLPGAAVGARVGGKGSRLEGATLDVKGVRLGHGWQGHCLANGLRTHDLDAPTHPCMDVAEIEDLTPLGLGCDLRCDGQLYSVILLLPCLPGEEKFWLIAVQILCRLDAIDEIHQRLVLNLWLVIEGAIGVVCKAQRMIPVGDLGLVKGIRLANGHLKHGRHSLVALNFEEARGACEKVQFEFEDGVSLADVRRLSAARCHRLRQRRGQTRENKCRDERDECHPGVVAC
mmetsp:Transcript_27693/g.71276  ORF Transcript_27693/g.71276 Transcript_27693/m.71276 type:complete len:269 (-) Transcript_27693:206-1012(-)